MDVCIADTGITIWGTYQKKGAVYDKQVHLFICWIGTHAEYDKLCNAGEQYSVNDY